MTDSDKKPVNWDDLPPDEKIAVREMAQGRLFWKSFMARAAWLKHLGSIILTLAAVWILFGDMVAEWLSSRN